MKTEQTGSLTGVRSYHAGTSLNSLSLGGNNLYNIFIFFRIVCFNFFFLQNMLQLIIMHLKMQKYCWEQIFEFSLFWIVVCIRLFLLIKYKLEFIF